MRTETLDRLKPVLSISHLGRSAGLKVQTLFTKMRRGTPLSDTEAEALEREMARHGLYAYEPGSESPTAFARRVRAAARGNGGNDGNGTLTGSR